MKTTRPYGTWTSPITSDAIVADSLRLSGVAFDGEVAYWLEGRPKEGGRYVLVRRDPSGNTADITPEGFNVRTRVHEYGGGAFVIDNGTIYFSNFTDQRIYRQPADGEPQPLTPEGPFRYADLVVDRDRSRLICVREHHSLDQEPENELVSIDAEGNATVLVSGSDFYSSPCLSPDGSQLAWLSWNHPNLPWDATSLNVANVDDNGELGEVKILPHKDPESVFQPRFSPNGTLYFVSDRSNWWNLYRWIGDRVEPVFPLSAEFATPQWVFGMSTYDFVDEQCIVCTYTQQGNWKLATLNPHAKTLTPIATPYTSISGIHASGDRILFLGGSPTAPGAVVWLDLQTQSVEILQQASRLYVDPGYISTPQTLEFPTENAQTAYGFFYPPTNKDFVAPEGEKPPLLVKSHGGPTSSTSSSLSLSIQYWTSRGFAILDVNYGGSTGYGRDYRQRLRDKWGIVDVDDCANGARFLVAKGEVDGDRLTISGGSAGGYTTLCALTFRDTFKAGASYYGVSDLEALARDTHKFESRYLDGLIGPYPDRKDLYEARSPIHHVDRLSCPVIFFQGLEDKIVPPNQAEMMVDALRQKGLPVAYVTFAEEQHGFRQADNIKRALDGEFYFYSRIFGYEPAEDLEPVTIENL